MTGLKWIWPVSVSGDSLEIISSPGSRAPLCLHRFDSKYPIPVSCILLPNIINQRKTIVNSWVRCLENNQLVITSGFPTVNLGNDRNSDYKYTILVLETQYFSCCLLHFSNSYLSIYLKTKKQQNKINKQTWQIKKEKKREKGKKKVFSRIWTQFGLTRPHIATTPLRMVTWFGEKSQV